MNAVVMEKHDKSYAVLCDDGVFRSIQGKFEIGQSIDVCVVKKNACCLVRHKTSKTYDLWKTFIPYVAAAIIILTGSGLYYETAYAYSYVTIDVNPSIELTLNRLNRVIDITALNEDAQSIVEELSSEIKLNTLSDAVTKTIDVFQKNSYLMDDDSSILIDVVTEDNNLATKLSESIEASVNKHDNITPVLLHSDKATREKAKESGISTGKYEVSPNSGMDINQGSILEPNSAPTQEATSEPEAKPEPEPAHEPEAGPATMPESESDTIPESKPDLNPNTVPDLRPDAESGKEFENIEKPDEFKDDLRPVDELEDNLKPDGMDDMPRRSADEP